MPYSSNMAANIVLLILLLLSAVMPFSNGNRGKEYKICSSPASCGLIKNIEYPFLVYGRPDFCGTGIHGFKLHCDTDGDYPYIWEGSLGKLWVKSINTSTRTMLIHRDKNQICQDIYSSEQNVQSDGRRNFFKFGASVANLTLFLGCPNITSPNSSKLLCLNPDNTSAYYLANGSSDCSGNVTLTMSMKALNEFNSSNGNGRTLESALEEPFEMEYDLVNSTDCVACQKSGGVCGSLVYSPSNFACYYPGKARPVGLVLGLASSTVGICFLILLVFCVRKRKAENFIMRRVKAKTDGENIEAYLKIHGSLSPKRYTYGNIKKMTHSFKEKLGEGGFAVVYKGELSNGQPVAVKSLKQSKGNKGEEFINEVASMGRTNHVNIVTLLGFCFDGDMRALIFEFMPNGSLDKFIHYDSNSHHKAMLPWKTIFDIAIGIARGLEYLHRGCNTRILHFDIKPHNILLDEEFRPKISDFGLARLCPQNESTTISMLEARGTIGYIAPEVFCRNFGGVSHKSDVYSYGMMVLDLVCGRRTNNTCIGRVEGSSELYFSDWIYQRVELGDEIEVHEGITTDEETELQKKMMVVSLWCIRTYPSNRPSISKVVEMLEGSLASIQMPPKPVLCSPPISTFDPLTRSCNNSTLD